MNTTSRWETARRVLAVRLDQMGDVLMTSPALAAIKDSLPAAHLTLLTSGSGAAAARQIPHIDETLVYEAPWVKGATGPAWHVPEPRSPKPDLAMIQRLAEGQFDAAVIFTVCTQNPLPAALMCHLAGIPLRLAHCRENPYQLLTDWVPDTEIVEAGMRHEVERQLALVGAVGFKPHDDRLVFTHSEQERAQVRDKLRRLGVGPDTPYFVVHPGATAASRRYPADRFGRAADLIASATHLRPVFTGSQQEADLIGSAQAVMQSPSVAMAGGLSLGEFGALLSEARFLLSNNTGPVHIAAALNTPVVDLYALTNPQHTPWRVKARVLHDDVPCRNCLKSVCPRQDNICLSRIPPERVAQASLELLAG